jgi:hypothetical protein
MQGRTFLSRGGNGTPTKQQILLHSIIGGYLEYPIGIPSEVKQYFNSPPNKYAVDIGLPEYQLAIEVDGKTHQTKKWKFLDKRKEEILSHLGWSVLRFTNKDIDDNPQKIAQVIQKYIASM